MPQIRLRLKATPRQGFRDKCHPDTATAGEGSQLTVFAFDRTSQPSVFLSPRAKTGDRFYSPTMFSHGEHGRLIAERIPECGTAALGQVCGLGFGKGRSAEEKKVGNRKHSPSGSQGRKPK